MLIHSICSMHHGLCLMDLLQASDLQNSTHGLSVGWPSRRHNPTHFHDMAQQLMRCRQKKAKFT